MHIFSMDTGIPLYVAIVPLEYEVQRHSGVIFVHLQRFH
jgi:hypothetical protein